MFFSSNKFVLLSSHCMIAAMISSACAVCNISHNSLSKQITSYWRIRGHSQCRLVKPNRHPSFENHATEQICVHFSVIFVTLYTVLDQLYKQHGLSVYCATAQLCQIVTLIILSSGQSVSIMFVLSKLDQIRDISSPLKTR